MSDILIEEMEDNTNPYMILFATKSAAHRMFGDTLPDNVTYRIDDTYPPITVKDICDTIDRGQPHSETTAHNDE